MKVKQIARIAHELNRAYCLELGDKSQPSWEDAPDWQKESAIHGVELHSQGTEISASASHDAWLAEKKAGGWVYGPVKNPEKKEHPCMVRFEDLPVEQQIKDVLFSRTVQALSLLIDTD